MALGAEGCVAEREGGWFAFRQVSRALKLGRHLGGGTRCESVGRRVGLAQFSNDGLPWMTGRHVA